MSDKSLSPINTTVKVQHPHSQSFRLQSQPGTDIYAAPAHGVRLCYVWTAPLLYRKINSKNFQRARVTVSFTWRAIYDQGGLILAFPTKENPTPDASNAGEKAMHPQWVKAGIEINDGKPWASVVARENWADWSLSVPPTGVAEAASNEPEGNSGKQNVKAVIEFERKKGALFVFVSDVQGQSRNMIREPQWVFLDDRDDGDMWIGVYCCSPDPNNERKGSPLEVTFENLAITEAN